MDGTEQTPFRKPVFEYIRLIRPLLLEICKSIRREYLKADNPIFSGRTRLRVLYRTAGFRIPFFDQAIKPNIINKLFIEKYYLIKQFVDKYIYFESYDNPTTLQLPHLLSEVGRKDEAEELQEKYDKLLRNLEDFEEYRIKYMRVVGVDNLKFQHAKEDGQAESRQARENEEYQRRDSLNRKRVDRLLGKKDPDE